MRTPDHFCGGVVETHPANNGELVVETREDGCLWVRDGELDTRLEATWEAPVIPLFAA